MFKQFDLSEQILTAVKASGFKNPTKIQQLAIPYIIQGRNLIGKAKTGTGKTAAFALPILDKVNAQEKKTQIVILVPTRELAIQVCSEIQKFAFYLKIKCIAIYGGSSYRVQINSIRQGAQIVVSTPGRLLDLMTNFSNVNISPSVVVIDEADEMLNMGFLKDIQKIYKFFPKVQQTLLFSATIPIAIKKLSQKLLDNPIFVNADTELEMKENNIHQEVCILKSIDRETALLRLLEFHDPLKTIIFCKTRLDVDGLMKSVSHYNLSAVSLHGDLRQNQREAVLSTFVNGDAKILIATDIASRGLDIVNISHVINYHLPINSEVYTHRIGRTGRMGNFGKAITLVMPREIGSLKNIERRLGNSIKIGTIPSLLDIREIKINKFVKKLETESIHKDAENYLKNILKNIKNEDLLDTSLKLISMYLKANRIIDCGVANSY